MSEAIDVGVAEVEKREAASEALGEVGSGMRLGLGTGSTVRFFLEGLSESLAAGRLSDVLGVPTSLDTKRRCAGLGIPTMELEEGVELDVAVDGADEVSPELDLIKGLGGALMREKVVQQAARRFVVIVDSAKEVSRLGERAPLPVEVAPFAWRTHLPIFRSLGADPRPREDQGGALAMTDNGNYLIDLQFGSGIEAPRELERVLLARAGVLETGLFLGVTDRVIVGRGRAATSRVRAGA